MRTFRLYVWKEWREHRLALLAVAGIAIVLMAGAWFLAPSQVLRDPLFPSSACLVVVLIALLAVGGELLTERREGGLRWLERMPAGLVTPFWSKLSLLLVTIFAAGALGIGLAFATAWTRGVAPEEMGALGLVVLALSVHFALWTFAASGWTTRSVLALFGAGFVLAGLGAPIWYFPMKGYRFQNAELVAGTAILIVGALPSGWLAFVTTGRLGRARSLGSLLGFAAAVGSFTPFWAWGLFQLHQRDRMDPQLEDFQVLSAVVTGDGRTAFVEARVWSERWELEALPRAVLRVDLATGGHDVMIRENAVLMSRWLGTDDCERAGLVEVGTRSTGESRQTFDLATGSQASATIRLIPPYRCEDLRGWLHAAAPFREGHVLTDEFTGKAVLLRSLSLPRDASVWSDLGLWFVMSWSAGAFRLDPDSGALEAADWLAEVSGEFGPRIADGRFFAPLQEGGIALVDPRRERVNVLLVDADIDRVLRRGGHPLAPFGEDEIVLLAAQERTFRFDPQAETLELVSLPPWAQVLLCTPGGEVFFKEGKKHIARLDLATGVTTRLFPR